LIFSFKFPFNLVAEPRSGEAETLTYPKWWTILKLARTIFAPRGVYPVGKRSFSFGARGGGKTPEIDRLRRVLQKLPKNRKNIGRTAFCRRKFFI